MIKYRLQNLGEQVLFQVLEMDEKQRRKEKDKSALYVASNNVRIRSEGYPSLQTEYTVPSVYLRGYDKTRDCCAVLMGFSNPDLAIKQIHEALKEWVARGGFFPEDKLVKDSDPYIFEV